MTTVNTPTQQQVSLSSIKPYDNNPRFNDNAIDPLVKSIENFGFLVPIVVDKDGVIITGHTRYEASRKLGLETVPVIYATHLTDEQVKAFRIADNRLSQNSTWNEDLLQSELRVIQEMGFDLQSTGFNKEELDCLTGFVMECSLDELDYESVCGAVEQETLNDSSGGKASFNLGGFFKFKVAKEEYLVWQENLLKKYGSPKDASTHLKEVLGFSTKGDKDA